MANPTSYPNAATFTADGVLFDMVREKTVGRGEELIPGWNTDRFDRSCRGSVDRQS
jgi:hypothetical protein